MKDKILDVIKDYKNKSNKDLLMALDLISQDFEYTKKTMINLSKHLDNLEFTYNKILKEYNGRISGG